MPSSMLDPFYHEKAAASTTTTPRHPTEQHQEEEEEERIPTYAESSATPQLQPQELAQIQHALQSSQPPPPQQIAPSDDPPTYAPLDSTQTTFMIYGTFIHTPSGPSYQLSSPLDTRASPFRIRRLRPREIASASNDTDTAPIPFDKTLTLYEVTDPPLLDEYHIIGKRRTCLPGVLELSFLLGKWRVRHVARPGAKAREILTSRRVGMFGRTLNRKREVESSEWKDGEGRVVATEVLRTLEDGGVVPVIELRADLDQTWRELLLSLWAARLWVAFGKEKTYRLGGRLANGTFAKLSGAAVVGGSAGFMGLYMAGS